MKQVKISELMDDYRDDEFFPEGGSTADSGAVKERVLAKAAPAGKRRGPRLKVALLAAALAAGCVLMIAAGMSKYEFDLSNGLEAGYGADGFSAVVRSPGGGGWPIVLENNRLWLIVSEDERMDITDKIDENTPQIYPYTDPEIGGSAFLVVGGTREDFGYAVVIPHSNGRHFGSGGGSFMEFEFDENEENVKTVYKPWYLNALKQLGLN